MLVIAALLIAGLPGQPGTAVLPDSRNMVAVSRWDRGPAEAVAVVDGITYVGNGTSILVIRDSVPAFAVPIGGQCEDLLVQDGNLYAAAGKAGLVVLGLGDPGRPQVLGGIDLPGYALHFARSGSLGAVASAEYGVTLLDLSDPAQPARISSFTPADSAVAVAIAGDSVYVACGADGVVAVDAGRPESPTVAWRLSTPAPARGVTTKDSVLFVMCGDSGALILNTRQPRQPIRAGWPGALAMDVSGGLAAVACGTYGVWLEDVSDPARPESLSYVALAGFGRDVAVGQGLMSIASVLGGVLRYDVSAPATPVFLSRSGVPGYTRSIATEDNVAWVGTTDGLRAVDLSLNPARDIGFCPLSRPANDVALGRGSAAVALGDIGLAIVMTGDPQNPSLAATLAMPDSALSVAVLDSWAFLGTADSGLFVVSVVNPQRPAVAANLALPGPLVGMSLRGALLAVAAGDSGLYLVDVAEPTSPRQLVRVGLPGFTNAVGVGAGFVAACGPAGLSIVDIRGLPRAPVIGYAGLVAPGWAVAVADTLCYVATDWAGVIGYNVSDRSFPWASAWYAGATLAWSVALAGTDVLMGDLYSGVTRLRVELESAVPEPAVKAEPSAIVSAVSLPPVVIARVRPSSQPARVSLFDQSGRKVAAADVPASALWRAATFPALPLGAGVFFVRVERAGRVETLRTCLAR
jgi:hypothetical protein